MDHDRLLIGLIALSTLAKIKLSIGLILPGLESFSNYNIGNLIINYILSIVECSPEMAIYEIFQL